MSITAKQFLDSQNAKREKEKKKKYREDNPYYLVPDEGDTTRFKSRGDVNAYKKDQAIQEYQEFLRKKNEGKATATDSARVQQIASYLPNVKAKDYERPEPEKVEVEKIEKDESGKWYVNTYDTWDTKDGKKETLTKQRDAKKNEIPEETTGLSAELPKAKERLIRNDPANLPTTQDSSMVYNAGLLDKNISKEEAERYKPHHLKKKEFNEKSIELKRSKGTDNKPVYSMKDKSGNWVEIDKALYLAINQVNQNRLESIPQVKEAKKLKKKTTNNQDPLGIR